MKKRATWLRFAALAFAAVLPAAALAGCTEAEVNITATGLDAVYNGEAQLPEIEVTGSDEKNVTILAGETEVSEAVDAGEYSIVVTAGDAEETFTFTIAPKPVEIGSLSGFEKVYDGTANYTAEIVSPDGTIIGDELTATVSGTFDSPAVGTDKALGDAEVTLSGADRANYQAPSADGLTATVVAKELTIGGLTFAPVEFGDVEAAGIETYDVQYTGEPTLVGVTDGDEVSVTIEKIRFSELKVGSVALAVTAQLSGTDAGNYKLSASGGLSATIVQDESVFTVDSNGVLTGYTGDPNDLVIPETVNGVTVKGIADELFRVTDYTEYGFKTVQLPDTLESIGAQAFAGNILLESIVIPASVTNIGESAFNSCSELSSIVFEEGTAPLTVGVSAFEGTSATDVTIPARLTELPRYCFADCDGGSGYVKIHKDVTVIGQEAFLNRSNQGGFTSIILKRAEPKRCVWNSRRLQGRALARSKCRHGATSSASPACRTANTSPRSPLKRGPSPCSGVQIPQRAVPSPLPAATSLLPL